MKLSDLRRFCAKQQSRIRFPIEGGLECIITERGLCQIPALNHPPGFRLDDQFAKAEFFIMETVGDKQRAGPRKLLRAELETLTAARTSAVPVDHDE